jgi:hypothetical protein
MFAVGANAATVSGNQAKAVSAVAAKKTTAGMAGGTASRAVMTPGILKKAAVPGATAARGGLGGSITGGGSINANRNPGDSINIDPNQSQYALQGNFEIYQRATDSRLRALEEMGGVNNAEVGAIVSALLEDRTTDRIVPFSHADGEKLVQSGAVHEYVGKTLGDIHSALMLINGTSN